MELTLIILLSIAAGTFLFSLIRYVSGRRGLTVTILRYSTVFMLIAMAVLLLVLWLNGSIFETHTNILIG